jgi:hypothetical protein
MMLSDQSVFKVKRRQQFEQKTFEDQTEGRSKIHESVLEKDSRFVVDVSKN